jgi:hypothetical protein
MEEITRLFSDAPSAYRGKPFWAWNGTLEPEELRRQIRVMHRMGLGGFFMHSRVGLATEYLGDEWFRVVRAVVYFDHPQDAPLEHALCIDVWGESERVAVELDAVSSRRLAETLRATLEHDEVKALV